MEAVKTKRLVKFYEDGVKTVIYVSIHGRPVSEAVIVGPTRYFTRRVLIITNKNMSEAEAERLVWKILNTELRCSRCGYRGYVKLDVKNEKPDLETAICNSCDPIVGYALGAFEMFDVVFAETRGR
jgi:hypothetical protein